MTDRQLTILAAINLLIAVGAGAFGAHGLKRLVTPELLAVWQTGVMYHLIHGLGLFIIALLGARYGSPLLSAAGLVMFIGIVLFSGSLYVLTLTGTHWLGAITPVGGAAFLAAWAMVALAAYRAQGPPPPHPRIASWRPRPPFLLNPDVVLYRFSRRA